MRIVSVKILKDFWQQYPDSEQHLKAWVDEAKHADWQQPADIKEKYRSASVLKNRRIVFNIKGNHYRLIVSIAYKFGAIYVKFIGTHQQYDLINAETIELE
jgi:mRNA interferase HigB